ncbi:MAG: ethylbenzene dehydrogenase-related protein [Acidimicrobiia bacterium]
MIAGPPTRRRAVVVLAIVGVVAAALQIMNANPAVSQTGVITSLRTRTDPGLDPSAGAWSRAPEAVVQLSAQRTAAPMGGGSITAVRVRSLHHGSRIYVRVEWDDRTRDVSTASPGRFADAVAVELPAVAGSSVPAVCMGQADSGVDVWQWRADRQYPTDWARVHPNGYVDGYPKMPDGLDYPARKVGNLVATPGHPAQDLVARGFGTLAPARSQAVQGRGVFGGSARSGHWAVVFSRDFKAPSNTEPDFSVGKRTDVAFAVWNGSKGDRNGIKSVSAFSRLAVSRSTVAPASSQLWLFVLMAVLLLILGLLWFLLRRVTAEAR